VSERDFSMPLAFINIPSDLCKFVLKNERQHQELSLISEAVVDEVNKLANPFNV